MTCKSCQSDRIAFVSGKTADLCTFRYRETEIHGYVPPDIGIGGGDYIRFRYCLDCGMIQASAHDGIPADPEVLQAILDGEY